MAKDKVAVYVLSLLIEMCIVIMFVAVVIRRFGRLSVLLLYPAMTFIQYIANCVVLDSGIYVYELGRFTYNVYAAQKYLAFLAIFLCFLILFTPRRVTHDCCVVSYEDRALLSRRWSWLFVASSVATVLLSLYVFLDMTLSGIPLFSGGEITHYNYFKDYSLLPLAGAASNYLTFCAALLGVCYSLCDSKRNRSKMIALLFLALCVRILLGFRATGLIDVAIAFFVGAFLFGLRIDNPKRGDALKIVLLVIVGAFATIGMFLNYQVVSGDAASFNEAWKNLCERFFEMGAHMWWSEAADINTANRLLPYDMSEVMSVFEFGNEFDANIGVYGMMRQYGNSYIVDVDMLNQVRFTTDFITTAIYYNGLIFGILQIMICAAFTAGFLRVFAMTVKKRSPLDFIILYRIFIPFTTYLCATGTLTTFFNIETYFMIGLFLYVRLIETWIDGKQTQKQAFEIRLNKSRQFKELN